MLKRGKERVTSRVRCLSTWPSPDFDGNWHMVVHVAWVRNVAAHPCAIRDSVGQEKVIRKRFVPTIHRTGDLCPST
jgi:hypothetical protein